MARGGEPTHLFAVVPADLEQVAVLDMDRIKVVLVDPARRGRDDIARVIAAAHERGIAALVFDDLELVRAVEADGVHLSNGPDLERRYRDARAALGGERIVGCDVGRSRHDAMTLGELGADYIGFGIPPHVQDRDTARRRRTALIAWWSELFELSCVAFDVASVDEGRDLVRADADFLGVRVPSDAPMSSDADAVGDLEEFRCVLDLQANEPAAELDVTREAR